MTTWAGRSIAHHATAAGFAGDDLKTAVAVALAASGGNDHYDIRSGVPGAGHWQGLWAINVDERPDYAALDLHEPYTAAQAAKALTEEYAGFGWAPTYTNGTYRRFLTHVGTETTKAPFTEPLTTSTGVEEGHVRRRAIWEHLASLDHDPTIRG